MTTSSAFDITRLYLVCSIKLQFSDCPLYGITQINRIVGNSLFKDNTTSAAKRSNPQAAPQ